MRLSFGMVLIIILVLVVACLLSFFWVLLTPRWSFTIVTSKISYANGEDVQITVTLKNMGYIPQSITSAITSPVVVTVKKDGAFVWYAPRDFQINQTTFTIAPNQPLIRVFVWNQSWNDQKSYTGEYFIIAAIPNPKIVEISDVDTGSGRQFYTFTEINLTAV
jgi:plastocyanin domain-containing protein